MKNNILFVIFCILMGTELIYPQNEGFILSTDGTGPYYPAYTGNGYFSITSTRSGLSPAQSYMIKVYAKGKNDIPRIAELPSWNEIKLSTGAVSLEDAFSGDSVSGQISGYKQTLDMYNGTIETNYTWNSKGQTADIFTRSFVSRADKNTAAVRLEIVPHFKAGIVLEFPLEERANYKRMPLAKLKEIKGDTTGQWPVVWYPGFIHVKNVKISGKNSSSILQLVSQCEGSNTKVALAAAVMYEGSAVINISSSSVRKSGSIIVQFAAEPGKKYVFNKIIAASANVTDGTGFENTVTEACRKAVSSGYARLFEGHKAAWQKLWQTDIITEGDILFQKAIHSSMFYLLSSIEDSTGFSIPPMGLSSCGYYGHIFWDADTYMFPPLLLMHPGMAESMVMFRFGALKAAMENAKKNKYTGAMYPWESDEKGNETTPFFAYQNALKENHIVGDVALAQWQYFLATKDTAWLRNYGSKVIFATADFWTSRVDYNSKLDRYEIGRLVSVNE
ncbi:MAG: hypothetical protein ACM3Q2_13970, partial [Syntrophothermus sp.]